MPGASRIFAGVSGSPGSVHALRQAADLARRNDAILIPLHTWMPPEGDLHKRRHPCQELRQLWEQDAWQRLRSCGVARYCLANADCPVLAIPLPSLAQEAGYGLRGWAFRHRGIRATA